MQHAFTGTWMMWVLNHLYLAAQLGVSPARWSSSTTARRAIYARLRNTILATWLHLGARLRAVPRRPAAAGRHRHRRHDHARRPASRWTRSSRRASTTSSRRCRACTSASRWPSASRSSPRSRNPVAEGPRAALGADDRPRRRRHRQPLRVRHRRRRRRQRAPATALGADRPRAAAHGRRGRSAPALRPGLRRGLSAAGGRGPA